VHYFRRKREYVKQRKSGNISRNLWENEKDATIVGVFIHKKKQIYLVASD